MSHIRVQNLTKRFGAQTAVFEVTFDVPQGETIALLGPSGCGKTTILRCLAGLETPDNGSIDIGGETVFDRQKGIDLQPEQRGLGIVFQSYAVWPHMTVAENVAFPLKVRGVPPAERRARAKAILDMVGLAGFEDRSATLVSGGQQQRVALARALVHEPKLVLFDEALSNLDATLRGQMRVELRDLQERLGFTAVYVTHDQAEAFGLADRIILMNAGVIDTMGAAREIFHHPRSAFTARFFGMNVLEGLMVQPVPDSDYLEVELNDRLVIRGRGAEETEFPMGGRVLACIRKDSVRLTRAARPEAAVGRIQAVSFQGADEESVVDIAGVRLVACGPAVGFAKGDPVDVTMTPDDWVFVR